MTDEIRKLLGGYATNTLTETERQTLFEAALDDQELFDALQKEQALRDLLDDPVSRVQIRQALDKPAPAPWWSRWWTWTAAASAVAAVVLIVAVTRTPAPIQHYAAATASRPQKVQSDAEIRPEQPSAAPARVTPYSAHSVSKQAVRARPALAENARKDEPQPAPAAPPPPVAVAAPQQQVQLGAQSPTVNGVPSQGRNTETQAQNQQVVISQSNTSQFNTAFSATTLTPLRYTLLKRDVGGTDQPLPQDAGLNPGDAVRIRVAPMTSGYLVLSRQNAAGQLVRLFPETGPGLSVTANGNYIIPGSSIEVTRSDQRFRLTLIPASMLTVEAAGQLKAKTRDIKKESNPNPPFFVDLVIGPAVR
jgi:cytoskeletal protein RodZ